MSLCNLPRITNLDNIIRIFCFGLFHRFFVLRANLFILCINIILIIYIYIYSIYMRALIFNVCEKKESNELKKKTNLKVSI